MIIHFIYPHKNRIRTPDIIGIKIFEYLRQRYKIKIYDWDLFKKIYPRKGDILIGHLHPNPLTIMQRSFYSKNWEKRIIIQPFNGDKFTNSFLNSFVRDCDLFITICGKYWYDSIKLSPLFKHWSSKCVQLDLAVDTGNFPFVKKFFNSKNERRFLYIGNDNPLKNLKFLNKLSHKIPNNVDWVGSGCFNYKYLNSIGYLDFSDKSNQKFLEGYDFLISLGTHDANPTTVLEAIAWGIIPITSKTSGYTDDDGVIIIDITDINKATNQILNILNMGDYELLKKQHKNLKTIKSKFTWDVFLLNFEKHFNLALRNSKVNSPIKYKNIDFSLSDRFIQVKRNLRVFLAPFINNFRYLLRLNKK